MKNGIVYIVLWLALFTLSCKKIDKTLPVVETLTVNGFSGDTLFLAPIAIYVEYEITDNEEIQSSRIRMVENSNLDSGFFHLTIKNTNSNYFKGSDKISIPDSILNVSKLYTLTIDAFDASGNQAIQKKSLINFK